MGSIPAMCAKLSAVSAILRGTEPVSAIKGALALKLTKPISALAQAF